MAVSALERARRYRARLAADPARSRARREADREATRARRAAARAVAAPTAEPVADVDNYERPQTRADCLAGGSNAARPCPWVSCRHHLAIDVLADGGLRLNYPGEVWEMRETCSLDVADRGGAQLEDVGEAMGVGRERARQIENSGYARLRRLPVIRPLGRP